MKKLGNQTPTERLLISRGNSRVLSGPARAIFSAFSLNDYENTTVTRIHDYVRARSATLEDEQLPHNVVRFVTLRPSRRKA